MISLHARGPVVRLGDRIRKLRKKHGWTQVEMAEQVGIDRSFLADVERGKRNISVLNLALHLKGAGRFPLPVVCKTLENEPSFENGFSFFFNNLEFIRENLRV